MKDVAFVIKKESIDHLFFECPVAVHGWRGLLESRVIMKMPRGLEDWLYGEVVRSVKENKICNIALMWAIWKWRNNTTFNNKFLVTLDQILISTMGYVNLWGLLSNAVEKSEYQRLCVAIKEYMGAHRGDCLCLTYDNG